MDFLHPIYCFAKDQGSLIAGFMTLGAGILAYIAGQRQATATREQSAHIQVAGKRKLAGEGIAAARIMKGVLDTVRGGMDYLNRANSKAAPMLEILPYLGLMSADFISKYSEFWASLEDFRNHKSPHDEFRIRSQGDYLKVTLVSLQNEADDVLKKCHAVIATIE